MATPVSTNRTWRFDAFTVDTRKMELRRGNIRVKMREQSFLILVNLLEHAGEIVTREELRRMLWPSDTFVDFEHCLNMAVMNLRDALGDSSETPRYIETIPKHGYRFTARLAEAPEEGKEQEGTGGHSVLSSAAESKGGGSQPVGDPFVAAGSTAPSPAIAEAKAHRVVFKRWLVWAAALASLTTLVLIYISGVRNRSLSPVQPVPNLQSIAVLPLENLSNDPEQEYFAEGMTDALVTELGRIGALRVISRQSIMPYAGSKKPLPEIAHELDVDAIVQGAVQRSGDRVRITAQLLEGKTDRLLWAESYERDFRDVLNLQREVAQDIVRQIEGTISPEQFRRSGVRRTVNPEAYEAYLKGRFRWYGNSSQSFDEAEHYFQLALEKDPDCALAYAGMADVWLMRADFGLVPSSVAMPKAMTMALTAVRLDQNLSEAHVTLANISALYNRDWAAAAREFRLAIGLNPNNADAHLMYADYLISLKLNSEWQQEIQQALAIDPISSFTRTYYGGHLIYLGRYEEAVRLLRDVLASQPDDASAHLGLWGAYYKKHMEADAMAEAVKYFEAIHDQETVAALGAGYRQAGYREGMKRAGDLLALRAQQKMVPGVRIARFYAHAGSKDQALMWLDQAEQAREPRLSRLAVSWDWDSLRTDARFENLMRRMKFPFESLRP